MARIAKQKNVKKLTINYSGHGCENSGDWVAAKNQKEEANTISLEDVLNAIQKENYDGNVEIVCDCCFAGNWAYKAQELSKEGKIKQLRGLGIEAASGRY